MPQAFGTEHGVDGLLQRGRGHPSVAAELDAVLPKLQVLARSSPDDKHTLVTRLNGKALPKNQQEWEAHHPGRDWSTERDKILPGYLEEWKRSRGGKAGEVPAPVRRGAKAGRPHTPERKRHQA